MRPNAWTRFGVAFAFCTLAAGARGLPGAVPVEEAALIRAVVRGETVVGETHKTSELPCGSADAPGAGCKLDAEFARGIALANARRGYLQCSALDLEAKRCVRRREIKRRVFHRFPAVMFSRPAFSTDGKSAVVYRTRYASAEHGLNTWVFLTRGGSGQPWTIALEQLVSRF